MKPGVAPTAIAVGLIAVVSGWLFRPSEHGAASSPPPVAERPAPTGCAKQVVDDWYADGRVDGTYALHCYDDALAALPTGPLDETGDARTEIERARAAVAAAS